MARFLRGERVEVDGPLDEDRVVTMFDVAAQAGVSLSSVSRVLSNHPDVSAEMRQHVRRIATELGYTPDPIAQSLRRGSTRTIGFVVRDIANPFFGEIVSGAEQVLGRANYAVLLINSGGDVESEASHMELLVRRRVDALVVSLVSETNARSRKVLASTKRPFVVLDRDVPGSQHSAVMHDHRAGLLAATTDLLRLGHRRIAILTGPTDIRSTRERLAGFTQAHEEWGISPHSNLVLSVSHASASASDTTLSLMAMAESKRPTAIISGGVQQTVGVLNGLSDISANPGLDVALVACDEPPLLRAIRPPISVVTRDAVEMGRQAAYLVLGMLEGASPRVETLLTQYTRRDTSGLPQRTAATLTERFG